MKKYFILLLCVLLLTGCGKVKLKDGSEAVVSFKKGKTTYNITADDLYEKLKETYGLQATIRMIDTYVLETEFKDYIDDAKKEAGELIKYYSEMLGGEDKLLDYVKQNFGYSDLDGYKDALYLSVMETHSVSEYAKTLVTDKEINKYYKESIKGDVEVYHILVTPKVKDDMTEEDKEKKEKEAKETAEKIIKELNKADNKFETFKKLVKEYTDDDSTKEKDGNLGFINYGDLGESYDELLDTAYTLKDGEYSKKVIGTELGYHVIYRKSIKDKKALKDVKDKIIETLSEKKINEDSDISVNSIKYYRELYNMKINDSELKSQYGIYLNNLLNQKDE